MAWVARGIFCGSRGCSPPLLTVGACAAATAGLQSKEAGTARLLGAVAPDGTVNLILDSPGLMEASEGPRTKKALGWDVHRTQSQCVFTVLAESLTMSPLYSR